FFNPERILYSASRFGYMDYMKKIIEEDKDSHLGKFDVLFKALTNACNNSHLNVVKYLIDDSKYAMNVDSTMILNCLNIACYTKDLTIVKYMLPKYLKTSRWIC